LAAGNGETGLKPITEYDAQSGASRRSIATRSAGTVRCVHNGRWLAATQNVWTLGAQLYNAATLQSIGVSFRIKDKWLPADAKLPAAQRDVAGDLLDMGNDHQATTDPAGNGRADRIAQLAYRPPRRVLA
jgi:hypothetical protein